MARELLIIDGKCYEITNLGWNPKQCNPQVKKMCEGKDLRAQYRYVKKNSDDRTAYTSEHIAKELGLGFLEDKLFEILERDLAAEQKINEEIKVRFVRCNTCTEEMKSKCLMFSENLCEGERCEELVDLMALVNKS